MVYSEYIKQRILSYYYRGYKATKICRLLASEGFTTTRTGVFKLIRRYEATGSLRRKEGSGRPSIVDENVKGIIEDLMEADDETTASHIHDDLQRRDINLSCSSILRCRKSLGWNYQGTAYCQMIRDVNKEKRLEWAQENKDENSDDVIWTDESTVQLETHRRFCCRKRSQKPRYKPR